MENKAATKGAYRFFRNKKVSPEKLLCAHLNSLAIASCQTEKDYYLCLSDTTTLDYSTNRGSENLGYLTKPYARGTFLHNDLIVNFLGVPVCLLKQQYNNRTIDYFGKSKERKHWPTEQKESVRWLNSFHAAQAFSEQQGVRTVWIADREADIIDVFAARWQADTHIVVRSQHNRTLANSCSKLYSLLKQQTDVGTYQVKIIHPKTLKKRKAKLAIRFCPVQIKVTTTTKDKNKLGHPWVNAIEVYEVDAPDDIDPIRWVLLTTLPITTFEQALKVVRLYIKRWLVERFHYLLKTGGAIVEQLQLEQPQSLQNIITTYSIAMTEIMKVRFLAENQPDIKIDQAGIDLVKCEILYAYAQKNVIKDLVFDAENLPTVYEYCRVLGMIGGFFPRKSQPLPGLKILTRASDKLNIILQAYDVFMSKNSDF